MKSVESKRNFYKQQIERAIKNKHKNLEEYWRNKLRKLVNGRNPPIHTS